MKTYSAVFIIDSVNDETYLNRWDENDNRTNFVASVKKFIGWRDGS